MYRASNHIFSTDTPGAEPGKESEEGKAADYIRFTPVVITE